ncbi:MAG: exosortase-associated EpsI family protein [Limisphaerales bacterium]
MCGALWSFYPLPDAQQRIDRILKRGGQFAGADVPLTEREQVALGRVRVLHRRYEFKGRGFLLTVIDGTRNRHAVHDPRYCFQGAGWRIAAEKQLSIPGGVATWLRLTQGKRVAEALFWFSDGASRYSSVPRYWWEATWRRATLGRCGGEPVMVVLQAYGDDPPDWGMLVDELVGAFGL